MSLGINSGTIVALLQYFGMFCWFVDGGFVDVWSIVNLFVGLAVDFDMIFAWEMLYISDIGQCILLIV